MPFTNQRYQELREIIKGRRLPLAFLDLPAFDANVAQAASRATQAGKTIRLGTKSIRCEALLRRITSASPAYRGFLTYTVEETGFLAEKGHDDFVVAYPSVQPCDLELLARLTARGLTVSMVIDSREHLSALSAAGAAAGTTLSACLELDVAYRPFGLESLHLGLRRSPVRTPAQARELADFAHSLPGVRLDGLMGYEGHIAGVNDAVPGQPVENLFLQVIKRASVRELTARRGEVVLVLREAGVELRLINGGGSGSLVTTLADPSVTEATVGSGFFAPALFHHFKQVAFQPAAFFALQAVRAPKAGMVACQGGGYIASGPTEAGKAPLPVMPVGMRYLPLEGAGEVQTPLRLAPGTPEIALGDPLIFQHAKAGELCERFDALHLIQGREVVGVVPTYRGEGVNFH